MKKVLFLMMLVFSTFVFGNEAGKIFGERITEKVTFGMSREEVQNAISKTPLPKSKETAIYYSGVEDPVGVPRNAVTFSLTDNKVSSAVFSSKTTEEEHRQIMKMYSEKQDTLSGEKLKKIEKQKSILMYNDKKTIEVYRIMGYTYIVVQPATAKNTRAKTGIFRIFR